MARRVLPRCVKCLHRCLTRCQWCDDPICYYHRIQQENGKFECSPCHAKFYIIAQAEIEEQLGQQESYHEIERFKCYDCHRDCLVACENCGKPCCRDHRILINDTEFRCVDCYLVSQEVSDDVLRQNANPV